MSKWKVGQASVLTAVIILIAAWWNSYLSTPRFMFLLMLLGIGLLLVGLFFVDGEKEQAKSVALRKREEEERKAAERVREQEEEAKERRRKQKEEEDRKDELARLAHEKLKLQIQRETDELRTPPIKRTPDEVKFDDYRAKRTFDARETIFKTVLQPTMTAMELEKGYEKQKAEINGDPGYTDAQKDRLLGVLREQYRRMMEQIQGRDRSIYED